MGIKGAMIRVGIVWSGSKHVLGDFASLRWLQPKVEA
jgi:hypothetical protein